MASVMISCPISVFSFLYTFHVLYHFMHFTSVYNHTGRIFLKENNYPDDDDDDDDDDVYLKNIWKLTMNTCLLSTFMFQHSFMATDTIKRIFTKFSILELERSIYNLMSAAALHLIIEYWQSVPAVALWQIDTATNSKLWLFFSSSHFFGWFIIYSGCIMLDISELTGLKQVYYKISKRPLPLSTKSREYQRYLFHMRHPSFTAFLIILWVHPYMTLDRFFMSLMFTIYMLTMWAIDEKDYCYHATHIIKKREKLL